MRGVDQRAIRELGIPGATLMENAGRGAAVCIQAALPDLGLPQRGVRVAIVCGKGGNGGDGFVVARWLKRAGHRVEVFLLAAPDELRGDPALKLREMERRGLRARVVEDVAVLARALPAAQLVVDAMLGTGARGEPSAPSSTSTPAAVPSSRWTFPPGCLLTVRRSRVRSSARRSRRPSPASSAASSADPA
jgi:hydroxyethylthiazole kinase-like uncharacterized protein yjeF